MRNIKHSSADCSGSCCLAVKDLTVRAGRDTIFQNVNFHVHCGEIVALIGPNGAGKSTLIKSLLGQREYSGSISFSPAGGQAQRPLIGYVPQSPSFDPGEPVSVMDLFTCCIGKRPVFLGPGAKNRQKVLECLARVKADSLIDQRIGTLSGGELQRVLLALALEPVPHMLILDEPMSGVDAEGMERLKELLDEIRVTYDLSILITTHDFSSLRGFADKVLLLKDTIVKVGTVDDVLDSQQFRQVFDLEGGQGK